MSMKHNCRINKTPFVLWFTQNHVLDIDFDNNTSADEYGLKSSIKKVNTMLIFIIKYFPILMLFAIGSKLPDSREEALLFGAASFIVFILRYLFINNTSLLKKVFLALMIVMYIALFMGYVYEVELITLFSIEVIMTLLIYREIALGKYKNYYYLENYKRTAKITLAKKKKRPLIRLWKDKGFFKKEMGFDVARDFSIGGYFFRLDSKIDS